VGPVVGTAKTTKYPVDFATLQLSLVPSFLLSCDGQAVPCAPRSSAFSPLGEVLDLGRNLGPASDAKMRVRGEDGR